MHDHEVTATDVVCYVWTTVFCPLATTSQPSKPQFTGCGLEKGVWPWQKFATPSHPPLKIPALLHTYFEIASIACLQIKNRENCLPSQEKMLPDNQHNAYSYLAISLKT